MTKKEALAHLEKCMKHNPGYRKEWTDYIRLIVQEEFEPFFISGTYVSSAGRKVADRVLRLFEPHWWEFQGNSKEEPGE